MPHATGKLLSHSAAPAHAAVAHGIWCDTGPVLLSIAAAGCTRAEAPHGHPPDLMARATSASACSWVMSSSYEASKTAIAFREPEPIVQYGRLSVEPWGYTCSMQNQHAISEGDDGSPQNLQLSPSYLLS